jgi:hypothetical protein
VLPGTPGSEGVPRKNSRADAAHCPVCNGSETRPFLIVPDVPVFCNVLWPTRTAALAAETGDIELALCDDCGHVFNSAFDDAKLAYSEAYENSLHFSQHFNQYARDLATRLVDTYGIRGKNVIDVGCGGGDFLALVCEIGANRGYGFDKSYPGSQPQSDRLTFVRDFYGERYAHVPCDLLCCRHVLEHIEQPFEFMTTIRKSLADRRQAAVYFEVPNSAFTLDDLGIWDLIYEHCSYFSESSLERLFGLSGFKVRHVSQAYGGQFLCIECVLSETGDRQTGTPRTSQSVRLSVDRFPNRYRDKLQHWQAVCRDLDRSGKKAVVWGGGSKGVTFLNILKPTAVLGVVDLNPRKHGRFVPVTGHELMAPDRITELQPDVVLVMNGIYRDEIARFLEAKGLSPELLSV